MLEYLDDVMRRYSRDCYVEKKSAFDLLAKVKAVRPELAVDCITGEMARKHLDRQFDLRSGYAANRDRKNLAAAWKWGRQNISAFPQIANPFRAVAKYPEVRSPRYVPPEADFWEVYQAAAYQDRQLAGKQDQAMLLTFLHTAARRSEVFRLQHSDLDFTRDQIQLWTRKRRRGNLESDWIPLTSALKSALIDWIQARPVASTYLFVCLDELPCCEPHYGKPFKARQHLMERLCKAATKKRRLDDPDATEVKAFGFHAIRHLTASTLYRAGEPLWKIQAILRHQNPTTTERYLKSLGLVSPRDALENNLRGPAEVFQFPTKKNAAKGLT